MNDRICSIEGCGRPVVGRGWCNMHYLRWKRTGSVIAKEHRSASPEESFSVRAKPDGDCVVWTGSTVYGGYGQIWVQGRKVRAHRYVWERANGPISRGLVVRHKCDNPPCVRLDHLEIGTLKDNTQDMIARGRAPWQKK